MSMARPSPSESADNFGIGQIRQGNNGLFWTSTLTSWGTRCWVLTKRSKIAKTEMKAAGVSRLLRLRPTVMDARGKPVGPIACASIVKSSPALGGVWKTLGYSVSAKPLTYMFENVVWNGASFEVVLRATSDAVLYGIINEMHWYYNEDDRHDSQDTYSRKCTSLRLIFEYF
jgi:hypothetical protein